MLPIYSRIWRNLGNLTTSWFKMVEYRRRAAAALNRRQSLCRYLASRSASETSGPGREPVLEPTVVDAVTACICECQQDGKWMDGNVNTLSWLLQFNALSLISPNCAVQHKSLNSYQEIWTEISILLTSNLSLSVLTFVGNKEMKEWWMKWWTIIPINCEATNVNSY